MFCCNSVSHCGLSHGLGSSTSILVGDSVVVGLSEIVVDGSGVVGGSVSTVGKVGIVGGFSLVDIVELPPSHPHFSFVQSRGHTQTCKSLQNQVAGAQGIAFGDQ